MKPALLIGIILVVIGLGALAYQGITYTTHEQKTVLDLGPLKATATVEKQKTIPLPPILGVAALVGGVILIIAAQKRT